MSILNEVVDCIIRDPREGARHFEKFGGGFFPCLKDQFLGDKVGCEKQILAVLESCSRYLTSINSASSTTVEGVRSAYRSWSTSFDRALQHMIDEDGFVDALDKLAVALRAEPASSPADSATSGTENARSKYRSHGHHIGQTPEKFIDVDNLGHRFTMRGYEDGKLRMFTYFLTAPKVIDLIDYLLDTYVRDENAWCPPLWEADFNYQSIFKREAKILPPDCLGAWSFWSHGHIEKDTKGKQSNIPGSIRLLVPGTPKRRS